MDGRNGEPAKASRGSVPPGHPARRRGGRGSNRGDRDEFAAYAFDMLQSLREASTKERHAFLSYLMGLAAEEAIRLAEGEPSAAAAYSKPEKRK
ncbi:MAG: hypothetical protein RLO08_12590 [Parvibaculaceae bacterium]